ncbi:MAG TPA: hypothetical protein VFS10_04095 [Pyrinomonadaceae bacterium]|nr:hypothetical protein [Pyrinomonadaceae bacterium]
MSDASAREQTDTEAGRGTAHLRVRVSAPSVFEHVAPPPPAARRRLAGVLVGKAFLELLLLTALVVGFNYSAFPSSLQGSLDEADARGVRGWVVDRSRPGEPVEVQLYLDGRFVESKVAGERQGFVFNFDPPPRAGEHEARVYAVRASGDGARRTLRLVGGPRRFRAE